MGVIQSAVNQGLSIAALLATQSPALQEKRSLSIAEKNLANRKKVIGDIVGRDDKGEPLEITEHPELFEGQEGKEKSRALDIADEGYVEAARTVARINPSKENIERVAHRESQSIIRHNQRQAMMDAKQALMDAQAEKRARYDFNDVRLGGEQLDPEVARRLIEKGESLRESRGMANE